MSVMIKNTITFGKKSRFDVEVEQNQERLAKLREAQLDYMYVYKQIPDLSCLVFSDICNIGKNFIWRINGHRVISRGSRHVGNSKSYGAFYWFCEMIVNSNEFPYFGLIITMMNIMASKITRNSLVYSTACSGQQ